MYATLQAEKKYLMNNSIPYLFSFIVLAVILPNRALADCKITDTPEKFEVVCFGKVPTDNAPVKGTGSNSGKRKKALSDVHSVIAMNEEEIRMMEIHNQRDGFQGKRKTKEKAREKKRARSSAPNS